MMTKFIEFPKMPRLSREMIITEKIDGTNASINIINKEADEFPEEGNIVARVDDFNIRVGSRTRWITSTDDNFGFANWVQKNQEDIIKLGEGNHFGEWWGSGIQRGYGLPKGEKRFSLFNTYRWRDGGTDIRPSCCHVVPILYEGIFDTSKIEEYLEFLKSYGSLASPGFMKPEGIVIFHTAGNFGFKKTIEKDEIPKSMIK